MKSFLIGLGVFSFIVLIYFVLAKSFNFNRFDFPSYILGILGYVTYDVITEIYGGKK